MIRRRHRDAQDAVDAEDPEVVEEVVDQVPGLSSRPRGPWDGGEVEEGHGRLDMGALRIRGSDGLQMQVQMDEKSGAVSMVTLSADGGAVQVQAFAAPKSSGIWADVRAQLVNSINSSGGLVEEAAGEFGPELRAKVPGQGGPAPGRSLRRCRRTAVVPARAVPRLGRGARGQRDVGGGLP